MEQTQQKTQKKFFFNPERLNRLKKSLDMNQNKEKTQEENIVAQQEQNTQEDVQNKIEVQENPVEDKDKEISEEKLEEQKEAVESKNSDMEVKEEQEKTEEIKNDNTEEQEEHPVEKKKRHRRTKKEIEEDKASKESVKDLEEQSEEKESEIHEVVQKVSIKELAIKDYMESMNSINNVCYDEVWENTKKMLTAEIDKIKIKADLNPAVIAVMAENIDSACDMLSPYYQQYNAALINLTDKDTGKIAYIKGINSVGMNAEDRKLNAWKACVTYKEKKVNCNLLELATITRNRLAFIKSLHERLESKRNILFTMTAVMKNIK